MAPEALAERAEAGKEVPHFEADGKMMEVKQDVERLMLIRQELAKPEPDVAKVDEAIAGFLSERLKHFAVTQERRAIKRWSELKPGKDFAPLQGIGEGRHPVTDPLFNEMRGPESRNAEWRIDQPQRNGEQWKAKELFKLGQDFKAKYKKLGDYADPFAADSFKEENSRLVRYDEDREYEEQHFQFK
jgi:hypothetical protein